MLDSLVTTLDNLLHIQKKLIHCAERKQTILIERKVDALNELVQEEAPFVKQLHQLEKEWAQLVGGVVQSHPAPTFHQFIEHIPDETMRMKIQSRWHALHQHTVELQTKNKRNEILLQDALNFVQHMMEQITDAEQTTYYSPPLKQQPPPTPRRGIFDTKA